MGTREVSKEEPKRPQTRVIVDGVHLAAVDSGTTG
jgi:hypothetical protein